MPTVDRVGVFRFYFWSAEANEPPHVHIAHAGRYAKFWLRPVRLARNDGFRPTEINWLRKIVDERAAEYLARWHEHFGFEA